MKKILLLVFFTTLLSACASPTTTPQKQAAPTSTIVLPTRTSRPTRTSVPVKFTGCIDNTLRVRSGPGTDNEIIGRLTPQYVEGQIEDNNFNFTLPACVPVIGRNKGTSWVMVSYEGQTGWVFADYINIQGDTNKLAVVAGNGVLQLPTAKPSILATKTINAPRTDYILCKDTRDMIGSTVTCKIPRAYCSYQPSTSGSPTFCNDARYPGHNFTLVAWEKNWSDFDGSCILVSGTISLYNGKPQIEASSRLQVSACP